MPLTTFKHNEDTIIIKLGGSLVSPYKKKFKTVLFDFNYVYKLFKRLKRFNKRVRFVLVVGGGRLNKEYLAAFDNFIGRKSHKGQVSSEALDGVGMASITLNATMVRVLAEYYFGGNIIFGRVIKFKDYEGLKKELPKIKRSRIVVAGASKPGYTSDMDAHHMAKLFGSSTIVTFKNVEGVFDQDPKKHKDAKLLPQLTWSEYFDIIGVKTHSPRSHFPIDPVAARSCQQSQTKCIVINGWDLENIASLFKGERFKGSIVGV